MIPSQLATVQNATLFPYRIFPFETSGQATFVRSAGKMLKNATTPLGVDADTRSSAADRMITYRTAIDQPVPRR
jgi:hypothetical protein